MLIQGALSHRDATCVCPPSHLITSSKVETTLDFKLYHPAILMNLEVLKHATTSTPLCSLSTYHLGGHERTGPCFQAEASSLGNCSVSRSRAALHKAEDISAGVLFHEARLRRGIRGREASHLVTIKQARSITQAYTHKHGGLKGGWGAYLPCQRE